MEFTRRFLFHGNAAAIGGRILRRNTNKPIDLVIDSTCESSLMPVGGRSHSKVDARNYDDLVSFSSASTLAEGLFDNHRKAVQASYGRVPEDSLVAATRVSAEIHDVSVGTGPTLTVRLLRATLHSLSPLGSGQPSIKPVDVRKQTAVEGVFIDGHELLVELNLPVFKQYDTQAKLLTAVDNPKFVKLHGHSLFMRSGVDRRTPPPAGRLVTSHQQIHGTIVSKLRWRGRPFPGASIDHNSVKIPKFGRIYFGEILISDRARRLTMMRVKMGSPIGGDVAFASTEPNGSWS
jgi:hypothetical protein